MGRVEERVFAGRDTLAASLATSLAGTLRDALAKRPDASLVVSGGTTPRPLFAALRDAELAWERVAISLADERWVATDDPASNEGLARRELLAGRAAAARFVGLKTAAATPEAGCAECEARLVGLARPFDAVVLGLGEDGHTASLFPHAPQLAAALDPASPRLCLPIRPPAAPHPRLSLSLAALLDSRRIVLHLTGEAKRAVLARALLDGPVEEMPVRAVLRGAPRVEVWWAP